MTLSGSICSGGIGSYSYPFARQRGSFIYILRRLIGIIGACVSGRLPSTGRDKTFFAKPGFFISMDSAENQFVRFAVDKIDYKSAFHILLVRFENLLPANRIAEARRNKSQCAAGPSICGMPTLKPVHRIWMPIARRIKAERRVRMLVPD